MEDSGAVPERQCKTSVCTARALVGAGTRMWSWPLFARRACSTLKPRKWYIDADGMAVLTRALQRVVVMTAQADTGPLYFSLSLSVLPAALMKKAGGYVHSIAYMHHLYAWHAASVAVLGSPRRAVS